ncbi:MAG: hypothetical protein HQK66_03795 [Desulfamplus sp.]|nr:hypothetical protein [Desulfamplus sp.]
MMQYPLPESIGLPELLVGRKREFQLLNNWIEFIPEHLSKSRAILARRKSGKTAILQRIYNRLWSENGKVIPFYINFAEKKIWLADLASKYYRTFASQFISFMERDEKLAVDLLTLEQIKEYGISKSIKPFVNDVDSILYDKNEENLDSMWDTAASAPHRYAKVLNKSYLTMIDEFQNCGEYVYRDKTCSTAQDQTIPGTWHDLSESKLAPILVTGSYVGWLINIIDKYLEAGRLKRYEMNPYLEPEASLEAVYRYAEVFKQPITNESAFQINRLCMSDPFFISCVIQSDFEGKDLTTEEGVINAVHHEITYRSSEMSMTWGEYIELSLKRINSINSKRILLHLTKNSDREWTPKELKEVLGLSIDIKEINELLHNMVKADLIIQGSSDFDFRGLTDGTLSLILRNRFEKEIASFEPEFSETMYDLKESFSNEIEKLKKEKRSLQGMVNHLSGMMAEYLLTCEFRSKKRFKLSHYFSNINENDDKELNVQNVKMRVKIQRDDQKEMELDVVVESDDRRVVVVEVKKRREPSSINMVKDFMEKVEIYKQLNTEKIIIPAFFSIGGFKEEASQLCDEIGLAISTHIPFV